MSTLQNLVHRQANQASRISAGVQDGSLTKPEAAKLVGQQLVTDKMISTAKSNDGFVGPKERAQLRGRQAEGSKDIFQARHDGQTAASPTDAAAPAATPKVDRQQRQAGRIEAGVQDGSLTKPEAAGLARAEVRTDAMLVHDKADDGKVGPLETVRIDARQAATAAAIAGQRHDAQTQG